MMASVPLRRRRLNSKASLLVAMACAFVYGTCTFMLPSGSGPTTSSGKDTTSSRRNLLTGVVAIGAAVKPGSALAETVSNPLFGFEMPTDGPLAQFKPMGYGKPEGITAFERADGAQIFVGPIKGSGFIKRVRNARSGPLSGMEQLYASKDSDTDDKFEFTSFTPVSIPFPFHYSSVSPLSKEGLPREHCWYRVLKVQGKDVAGIIIRLPLNKDGTAKFEEEKPAFDRLVDSLTLGPGAPVRA